MRRTIQAMGTFDEECVLMTASALSRFTTCLHTVFPLGTTIYGLTTAYEFVSDGWAVSIFPWIECLPAASYHMGLG